MRLRHLTLVLLVLAAWLVPAAPAEAGFKLATLQVQGMV
jgi:hypothetical protein